MKKELEISFQSIGIKKKNVSEIVQKYFFILNIASI